MLKDQHLLFSRRKFVATMSMLGATGFTKAQDTTLKASKSGMTIREVIAMITKSISLPNSGATVDTIKAGNPDQPVTAIVTTMFTTVEVIRKAIEIGANFIIAHEPTFYNHADETAWFKDHDVYRRKQELLDRNNIVVWRFHDYWHAVRPDGILTGFLLKMGWEKYYDPASPVLVKLPGATLSEIMQSAKKNLGIEQVRYIGDPDRGCKTIAVLPGAWPAEMQIQALRQYDPDLLVCGEVREWETSEYIRDERSFGVNRSLLVLGHDLSEDPGMEWLVTWLKPKVNGIAVSHIPSGNAFRFA